MINNLLALINSETIYLAANWGVIPFWLLLIFFPNNGFTTFFVQSILAPLLLALGYIYLSYNLYLENNILDGFELYSGLDGLYSMFSNETFLLIFWLHFLSICQEKVQCLKAPVHCNQNDQENLDHLPGYTFGKDDESKWAIEGKIGFYLNLR